MIVRQPNGYSTFRRIFTRISEILNVGGVAAQLVVMSLIILSIVIRITIKGTLMCAYIYEIAQVVMLLLVFLGMGYTTMQRGHVTVDILVDRFSPRVQAGIDTFTWLLSLGLFVLMNRIFCRRRFLSPTLKR